MRRALYLLITWGLWGCGTGSIMDPGGGADAGSGGGGADAWAGGSADADDSVTVPLAPTEDNSSGVQGDGAGGLVLDPEATATIFAYIWVANSPEGTVSKIDTETGVEVARYRTGPGSPDPSRTTVGLDGDVVVANRGGSSAVRIHSDIASCPDVNGNGAVDTSTGPADVRPWGQDECVLWFHQFPSGSLARAAAFDFLAGPDGELSSSVWIGLFNSNKLVRLNASTGDVITEVNINGYCPYGMAFDGSGDLWVFDACNYTVVHLNTTTLAWNAVNIPGSCAYGITVDPDGRVWTSGGGCVGRYDPVAGTWATRSVGSSNRGLAHDGNGSVWVSDTNFGVHRLDAASMNVLADIPLGSGGFVGMAVDFHKNAWAISQGQSRAYKIDPATHAATNYPTGSSPYTYSDMTGFQLQNAAPPLGLYNAIVEGCGPATQWWDLKWDAQTNPGTFVRFRARAAQTLNELAAKPYVFIAEQPSDVSPADMMAKLEAAAPGGSVGHYLQIEIALGSSNAMITPYLHSVSATKSCGVE